MQCDFMIKLVVCQCDLSPIVMFRKRKYFETVLVSGKLSARSAPVRVKRKKEIKAWCAFHIDRTINFRNELNGAEVVDK